MKTHSRIVICLDYPGTLKEAYRALYDNQVFRPGLEVEWESTDEWFDEQGDPLSQEAIDALRAEVWDEVEACYDYGTLPPRHIFERRYLTHMGSVDADYRIENPLDAEWKALETCTGHIDAHLEAVMFTQYVNERRQAAVRIHGMASLYTLVRRLTETDNDAALNLASSILSTLEIEWI